MKDTIITVIVTSAVTGAMTYALVIKSKIKALFKSQCDQLRLQIIRLCKNSLADGYITFSELEALTKAYDSYHALGGNGSITALYEKTKQLEMKE